jgi:nucleotide-binding universal stress UspA family protein
MTTIDRPRIVVGVDGSPESEAALRWAKHLATTEDADVEVVSAWSYPVGDGWSALPVDLSLEKEMERIALDTVRTVYGAESPEHVHVTTVEGHPAKAILDRGEGAHTIVVGSRGLGGFSRILLGSVSERVAEHATVPVLVVHGKGERLT